jgi:ABC-type sugar transport system substrate-binding protein
MSLRKILLLLVVITCITMFVGINFAFSSERPEEEAATEKEIRIDFVGNGRAEGAWWAEAKRGWDAIADKLGFENPLHYGEEDPAIERAAFEASIASKPDAILLSNVFFDALNPLIPVAQEEGIPVYQIFIYDATLGPGCGVDWPLAYESMALNAVIPKLKEQGKFNKEIDVVFTAMTIDTTYAQMGVEGFRRGLDKAGVRYEWDSLDTVEDPAGIVADLKSYLLGHPDLDVICGVDGETTNRITIALKELDYKPGQILIVGSDIMEYSAQGIEEGYLLGAFTQGQFLQVQLAAVQLYNKVKYNFPMFEMKFPGLFITAESVAQFK